MSARTKDQAGASDDLVRPGDAATTARRHLRRNLALIVGEILCFATGYALFDSSTVLASFVSDLTSSAILLGLMPTVLQIGAGLPQLAAARYLANRPRKLPYITLTSALRSIPLFVLAGVTWLGPPPLILLLTFYVCYALFAVLLGAQTVAWIDVFGKVCPPELRGRVIAVGRTIGNVLSFGAGFVVARLLAVEGAFPRNYALLFCATAVLMTAAMAVFGRIVEPIARPVPVPPSALPRVMPDDRSVLVQGRRIWRTDADFRRLTLARIAYVAHFVAVPFYFVYARDRLGVDDAAVGLFVSALMVGQIAGNVVWGWLSARLGYRRVVQGALALTIALPFYVLLTPALPTGAFLLVYAAVGMVMASDVIGWLNLLLEVSPTERRPLYSSLHSTILLPANLLPLLGGVILTVVPYGLFFPLIALMLVGSLWLISLVGRTERRVG